MEKFFKIFISFFVANVVYGKERFLEDVTSLLASTEKNETKKICMWVNKEEIFYLNDKMNKTQDYQHKISDTESIYYNFCQDLVNTFYNKEKIEGSTMVYKKVGENNTESIVKLTGSFNSGNVWKTIYKIEDEKNITGIEIIPEKGDNETQIIYQIYCNYSESKLEFDWSDFKLETEKNITLVAYSEAGCNRISITRLTVFFEKYKVASGIIIILIGVYLGFFGAKVFKPTIVLIFGLVTIYFATIIAFRVTTIQQEKYILILLGVSFVVGIGIGFLLLKAIKFCFILMGAALGYGLGLFIYDAILRNIKTTHAEMIYWITLAACIIIFGLIGLKLYKLVLIGSTSVIGSYCIVRGASFFIGNFPDIELIVDLLKNGEFEQASELGTAWMYGYLSAWIAMVMICIAIQTKINSDKSNNSYERLKEEE